MLIKKTDLNAKITEIEGKIPIITSLATNSALTAVENKIPDVSSLVRKTDYNTKISDIEKKVSNHNHEKYITTPEYNTLVARVFNARLAQVDLVTKTDFDVRLQNLNKKIKSNKTKNLLVETELKKLEKFNPSYFRDKNYFDGDGTQNYLLFQPIQKYFKTFVEGSFTYISSWESKGSSNEKISSTTTSNYNEGAEPVYENARIKLSFNTDLLKQDKVTYNHGTIVNIYIVYRLAPGINHSGVVLLQKTVYFVQLN